MFKFLLKHINGLQKKSAWIMKVGQQENGKKSLNNAWTILAASRR
jgi:hypothetical protein